MEVTLTAKYIAFANNGNSKMGTREEALDWATKMLTQSNMQTIHLAEIVEVVERQSPPIIIRKFGQEPGNAEDSVHQPTGLERTIKAA